MPLIVAGIGAGAGLLGSLIGGSAQRDAAETTQADDTRVTSLEELFGSSFLESLSVSERNALETQLSTSVTSGISESATTGETSTTGVESVASVTGETTVRGTAVGQAALQEIIQGSANPSGEAAIQASINRVLRSGSPAVAAAGGRAGAFDSTVESQLANDLIIQAAEAGALTDLQQQNLNTQNLLAAVTAEQAGIEAITGQQDATTTSLAEQVTAGTELVAQDQTTEQASTTEQAETATETATELGTTAQTSLSDEFIDTITSGVGVDTNLLGQALVTPTLAAPVTDPNAPIGPNPPVNQAGTRTVAPPPVVGSLNPRPDSGESPNKPAVTTGQVVAPTTQPTGNQQLEQLLNPDILGQLIAAPEGELFAPEEAPLAVI